MIYDRNERILELIKSDSKITSKNMAEKLGVSDRTVKRHIAAMSNVVNVTIKMYI